MKIDVMTGRTFRGKCACGWRVGFVEGVTMTEAEQGHRNHARSEHRKFVKTGLAPVDEPSHAFTMENVTAEMLAKEEEVYKRQWAVALRDRRVPDKRADVLEAVRGIAVDLRRHADAIDRIAERGKMETGSRDGWSEGPVNWIEQTQHEVLWGLANLGMDRLLSKLRDYQDVKAELAAVAHLLPAE